MPRFAQWLIRWHPVEQILAGLVGLLVVLSLGPPVYPSYDSGQDALAFLLFAAVPTVIVTGLFLAVAHKYRSLARRRVWVLAAVASFVAGVLLFVGFMQALVSFTRTYNDARIVIGSDADYTPKARKYLEDHQLTTPDELIDQFPEEIRDFWNPWAVFLRYLAVVLLYLSALNAVIVCLLAVLQAIFCVYNPGGAVEESRPGPEGALEGSEMIPQSDIDRLVKLLAENATGAPARVGPEGYFRDLILASDVPDIYKRERSGGWSGAADHDARELVNWTLRKGVNPHDHRFTTLGSILAALLRQEPGVEQANLIVALIVGHRLIRDESLLGKLRTAYQVPQPAEVSDAARPYGPPFDWTGPDEGAAEFQAWLRKAPEPLDVGFLERAVEQARAVCRVERSDGTRAGTGFLIAPQLLLTNYHVLSLNETPDLPVIARDLRLRFGCFTDANGREAEGTVLKVDHQNPVVRGSPKEKLDYVLLRLDESVRDAPRIRPVVCEREHPPVRGHALHILQHAEGQALKLALSDDGVMSADEARGRLQYVTQTKGGASGSPCFNGQWKVVALHQAEVPLPIGSRRQGILLGAILKEIEAFLPPYTRSR